jgi:hypothetical protein
MKDKPKRTMFSSHPNRLKGKKKKQIVCSAFTITFREKMKQRVQRKEGEEEAEC